MWRKTKIQDDIFEKIKTILKYDYTLIEGEIKQKLEEKRNKRKKKFSYNSSKMQEMQLQKFECWNNVIKWYSEENKERVLPKLYWFRLI